MISYQSIDNFKPGTILRLIEKSYEQLLNCFPEARQRFVNHWQKEDQAAFNNPGSIGKCAIFTCINDHPIGYFSWDDRKHPAGIIGQNCVLPDYRGNGYGKKQIEEIIKLFQKKNFSEIQVITGDHDFFLPAHKLYNACGFSIRKRNKGKWFDLIEFYKILKKPGKP